MMTLFNSTTFQTFAKIRGTVYMLHANPLRAFTSVC